MTPLCMWSHCIPSSYVVVYNGHACSCNRFYYALVKFYFALIME